MHSHGLNSRVLSRPIISGRRKCLNLPHRISEGARQILGGSFHEFPAIDPRLMNGFQHLAERRPAWTGLRSEISACVKGAAIWSQKNAHGPAALAA